MQFPGLRAVTKACLLLLILIFIFLFIRVTTEYKAIYNSGDSVSDPSNEVVVSDENHSTVIFMETSGRGVLSLRQLAAIESSAYWNPRKLVLVYLFYDTTEHFTVPMTALRTKYTNIKFESVKMKNFVHGSLLELWYEKGDWRKSKTPAAHLSDGLRPLALWRIGGIYFDLDIMALKELRFPMNAVTWESVDYIGSGALAFQKEHPMILKALRYFVKNYNPAIYFVNGPPLITKCYKEYCSGICDVELLPVVTVTPVLWVDGRSYLDEKLVEQTMRKTRNSSAAHWWNDLSSSKNVSATSNCAFIKLVQQNCPVIFSEVQKQGWV